jgi:hypothetical protein
MDIKAGLKHLYPFLGTALASTMPPPFGEMAAEALGTIAGGPVKPEEGHDVMAKLAATTEGALKLKEVEYSFQQTMAKLGIDKAEKMAEIDAADRADARALQRARPSRMPAILTIVVTIGFFSTLAFVIKCGIPVQAHDLVLTLFGAEVTAWLTCVAFWVGSSAGSDRKTELLAQAPAVK